MSVSSVASYRLESTVSSAGGSQPVEQSRGGIVGQRFATRGPESKLVTTSRLQEELELEDDRFLSNPGACRRGERTRVELSSKGRVAVRERGGEEAWSDDGGGGEARGRRREVITRINKQASCTTRLVQAMRRGVVHAPLAKRAAASGALRPRRGERATLCGGGVMTVRPGQGQVTWK